MSNQDNYQCFERKKSIMDSQKVIREQLIALLTGHNAHLSLEQAIADFPPEHMNTQLPHVDYTPWQLLEHMRIAQWDIIEFVINPNHISPKWPEGYWPSREIEATKQMWENTVNQLFHGLKSAEEIVLNSHIDLYSPIPHAPGYNIFREILLIADHNAYHTGQFVLLKKYWN